MLHFTQLFRQLLCSTRRTICVNSSISRRSTHRSQKREIATGRQSEYPVSHCSEHISEVSWDGYLQWLLLSLNQSVAPPMTFQV
jgi:hypothetical protein